MPIEHEFDCPLPDNVAQPDRVQPSHWNALHVLTGLLALLDATAPSPSTVFTLDGSSQPQLTTLSEWMRARFGDDEAAFIAALNAAPINSPAFTGIPTAPTAALGTDTTQLATMGAVQNAINALMNSAPGVLDTLSELASALDDDPNFAATMTAALALKAPLVSPVFTGNPSAPTQSVGDGSTKLATTAYADAAAADVVAANAIPGSNVLINQDFAVDQRNEGTALAFTTSVAFGPDRWAVVADAATTATVQRKVDASPTLGDVDSLTYLRVQRTAASSSTAALKIAQMVEYNAMRGLVGRDVVLSFYARKGANFSPLVADTITHKISFGTGTDQGAAFCFAGAWTGQVTLPGSAVLTTSWQRFQTTRTVSPADTKELAIEFNFNPTGTAGAADYFDITGIKLELGTAATPLNVVSYADTLRACQRYYEKTFPQSVVPAANIGAGYLLGINPVVTAGTFSVTWFYKVPKRLGAGYTIPVPVTYCPYAAGVGFSRSGSGNLTRTLSSYTDNQATFRCDDNMTAAGSNIHINATVDAEMY